MPIEPATGQFFLHKHKEYTPLLSNPYKFSAYRTAALNTPNNASAAVAFDTENFDTNSNFDIATNVGRYTVPVSGFYQFNATISHQANIRTILSFYVNGTEVLRGQDLVGSGSNHSISCSGMFQLTAGQYVEAYIYTPSATAFLVSQNSYNRFSGFLVSKT